METELTLKIKDFAERKHNQPSDCQRYGEAPYTVHLDAVVANAVKYLYYIKEDEKEIVICAARGHDLVEDTDVSVSDIEKLTNRRVAEIIFKVSNERGYDRKEKNFKTYPKIWVDDLAIFVKLCDRIANTSNSKITGYKMYNTYRKEYPVFKYALKVRNLYPDMWAELDELNEYTEL
jgi:(p)ppGpp synthase/HD superfamily hydrolase